MAVPSRSNRLAHVIERFGLATSGASCGLFVAAYLAKSGIQSLMSVGFVLAMMVLGAVGFYLGIDMPGRARAAGAEIADRVEIMSAIGTFLAPVFSLICVSAIVLDIDPPVSVAVMIGLGWLFGVVLQIAAGITARAHS